MTRLRVVLLTSLYPWGPGEEFIIPELPLWVREDVDLTIMPWQSTELLREVPEGISVDLRLDAARRRSFTFSLASQPFNPMWWREAVACLRAGKAHPRTLWHAAVPAAAARLSRAALRDFAREHGIIDVAYSYWFDHQSLGALTAGSAVRHVVSRAHGYDLYEERSPDGRLPFKRWMAPRVALLAPISRVGLSYVRQRYNSAPERSACYHLGVDIGRDTAPVPASLDTLHFLSISNILPVKRLPRLVDTLAELARLMPERTIVWHHAGSGEQATEVSRYAAQHLPRNVTVTWLGHLTQQQLNQAMTSLPWNFMINVSSSEGVPVSLMESMSCAIPAAATDVGATAELVLPAQGLLLPSDDSPTQWAAAIADALPHTLDPAWRQGFRTEVKHNWNQWTNHQRFIEAVIAVGNR